MNVQDFGRILSTLMIKMANNWPNVVDVWGSLQYAFMTLSCKYFNTLFRLILMLYKYVLIFYIVIRWHVKNVGQFIGTSQNAWKFEPFHFDNDITGKLFINLMLKKVLLFDFFNGSNVVKFIQGKQHYLHFCRYR